MTFSKEHWLLLAAFLGTIGVQLTGVSHWHEVLTPQFAAGCIGQIAILIRGFFTDKPQGAANAEAQRRRDAFAAETPEE